ncbi:MAG: transposase, partial [bacterium]
MVTDEPPQRPTAPGGSIDYWRSLPGNVVQNVLRIREHEEAVRELDPDHYDVVSLRTPSRRVRVYRRGDLWRCRVDRENNQDRPCGHVLAVLLQRGDVELPNTAAGVWKKGDDGRDQSTEGRAWQRVPTRVPELLAQLLREALPSISPNPQQGASRLGGRPRKPVYPQVYQAILRVALRQNLHAARGLMEASHHREHNPYGSVGVATLSRFLANPETTTLLEKLLALTTWPARSFETLLHPDGTGLTEQRFSAYFDERYRKRKKDRQSEATAPDPAFVGPPRPDQVQEPRLHHWTYAEILWTYRYTLIAALHTQQGPFGEAPWLIPLVERARLTLDVKELGGDKAYDANYIFQYAKAHGIDAQIKTRRTPKGGRLSHRSAARKRAIEHANLDPSGYAAKANRRNNAETGNHAFKAILGDQIYSKNSTAQRNEILSMAIAYNLTRLVYLELDRGIRAEFGSALPRLASDRWVRLEELHE